MASRGWVRSLRVILFLAGTLLGCSAATAGPNPATEVTDAHYPEAPVWREGQLYFVEYAANNIRRWDGSRATTFWHRDKCGASGLVEFHKHWLVACYDENALVEVDEQGSTVRVLRTDHRGRPFRGPNDFAPDGRGGLYFSASGVYDVAAPIDGAVLHLDADGRTIREVANTIHYPNGLTLAKDGRHLLVAEMLAGRILDFQVRANGTLGERRVWARLQDLAPTSTPEGPYVGPDGLKLGPDGNYYIAQNGAARVLVVSEERKLVRSIEVPTPFVTNLAFGEQGSGIVYVTGAFDQWKEPYPGAVYRWQP